MTGLRLEHGLLAARCFVPNGKPYALVDTFRTIPIPEQNAVAGMATGLAEAWGRPVTTPLSDDAKLASVSGSALSLPVDARESLRTHYQDKLGSKP